MTFQAQAIEALRTSAQHIEGLVDNLKEACEADDPAAMEALLEELAEASRTLQEAIASTLGPPAAPQPGN
jgi:ABC-type transporter Mla subunit MlaD